MPPTRGCCYAGSRINPHLFVHYQQRFRLTDFFLTFVRNLNVNNLIGLSAERAMNNSKAASPIVIRNQKIIMTDISHFKTKLLACVSVPFFL
jgi:hypothetical protein